MSTAKFGLNPLFLTFTLNSIPTLFIPLFTKIKYAKIFQTWGEVMADKEALKDEYLDHMISPRNYGHIENYTAKGIGKNPQNGELVEIYLLIDENENIQDIKFQAIGCMSTIVTGSIFTDIVKGESIEEAFDVAEEFMERVKDAPVEERACAEMVAVAYIAAREHYICKKEGSDESVVEMDISYDCVIKEDDDEKSV